MTVDHAVSAGGVVLNALFAVPQCDRERAVEILADLPPASLAKIAEPAAQRLGMDRETLSMRCDQEHRLVDEVLPVVAQAARTNGATEPQETAEEAVARLAKLKPMEYDKARQTEADKLGVRVATLDKEVAAARAACNPARVRSLIISRSNSASAPKI
jgi:hypothetical protein